MRSWVDIAQSLLEGSSTAAWISVPDYAATKGQRRAAKAVIFGMTVAGTIATEAVRADHPSVKDDEPSLDDEVPKDFPPLAAERARTSLSRKALIVSATLLAVTSPFVFNRAVEHGAKSLQRRGVQRPRTVIGVAIGAVTALGNLAADR